MDTTKQLYASEQLAIGLSAGDVAKLLGISTRHVWSLHSRGQLPAPRRFGRSVRWLRAEVLDYAESGAGSRDEWLAAKATGR